MSHFVLCRVGFLAFDWSRLLDFNPLRDSQVDSSDLELFSKSDSVPEQRLLARRTHLSDLTHSSFASSWDKGECASPRISGHGRLTSRGFVCPKHRAQARLDVRKDATSLGFPEHLEDPESAQRQHSASTAHK